MERIEGLSIGLDLDALALDRGLTGLKDKLKTVNSEMKANLSSFDRADQSVKKYETRLNGLNKKLEVQKRVVHESKIEYEKMVAEYGQGSKEAEKAAREFNNQASAINNLQRNIGRTTNELEKLKKEQSISETRWGKLSDTAEKTGSKLTGIGTGMKDFGKSMSMYISAPIAGIGLASVNTAKEFEAQMSKVAAISGATSEEVIKLKDAALELGASTSKSASEVAAGQESLAAMGFTVEEILGAMPGVISAAEASGSDMAQTADVMASSLSIFGLEASEASRVADILAQTANQSAADLTDMQYALKYAGPPAAALGVSMEELSGAIGIMTNAGMQGEQAGTTLRAALLGLLDPSEENSKMMESMGIAITHAEGNFVGISNLITNLSESMEGQTETQKAATLASLVGTEAVSGMLSLMKAGPDEIDKMTKALENSGGASEKASAIMKENLKGALDGLEGSLESAGIQIGTILTPAIKSLTEFTQGLVQKFLDITPATQKVIVVLGLLLAGLGPLLAVGGLFIGFLGSFLTGLSTLFPAIAKVGGLLKWLRLGLVALTGPIGIVIGVLTLLGTGFILLYKNSETFRNAVHNMLGKIKELAQNALKAIQPAIQAVVKFFKDQLVTLQKFWDSNGQVIMDALSNIGKVIQVVFAAIVKVIQFAMPLILGIIQSVWGNIKGVISGALNVIMGLVKVFSGLLTGNFGKMWEGIKQVFSGALQFIWNYVQLMFWGKMLKGILSLGKLLLNSFKGMWTNIQGVFSKVIKWIVDFVKNRFTSMKNSIETITNTIRSLISTIWNGIYKFFTSVIKSIWDLVKNRFTTMKNTVKTIFNGIRDLTRTVWNAIKDSIYTPIKNAVTNTLSRLSDLKSSISRIFGTIKKNITGYVSDMVKTVKGMPQKMADGIAKGKTALSNGAKKLGNGMISGVGWGINKALDGVDWILDKLGSKKRLGNWEVPQFANGTPKGGHKGGLARIGDGNMHELVALPNGQMFISPNRDTLVNLPKGTEVLSGDKTSQLFGGKVPAFARGTGGWLDDLVSGTKNSFNKVKDWGANIWDWVKDKASIGKLLANKIASYGMGNLSGIPTELAKGSIKKAIDAGKSMLFGEVGESGGGAAPPGKGVERWRNTVIRALAMNGLPTSRAFQDAWLRQIKSESGGNPHAIQSSGVKDVNYYSGQLARGLVQVIPPTFSAYSFPGHKNWKNGLDSLLAGMNYAKSRYGSNMLGVIGHGHGYETGGLINNAGMYNLAEGGWPEWIIPTDPNRRTDAMKLLALAGKDIQGNKRPHQLPNVGNNSSNNDGLLQAVLEQNRILMALLQSSQNIERKPVISEGDIGRAYDRHDAKQSIKHAIYSGRGAY
ncbi:phage tail tape measure protein [Peribacillus frigoritolerans]|uniref:phage tail tape measure protein n=1 Tax=Peribacillus frigoritolerans TaxID=450367 RepID=UPI0023DC8F70|nr:phage tail tape measure protein [Peribacillus frigoritolerans]MDF1997599.1 phage tail tape measure protein [Peribacillus frigoritolerans]